MNQAGCLCDCRDRAFVRPNRSASLQNPGRALGWKAKCRALKTTLRSRLPLCPVQEVLCGRRQPHVQGLQRLSDQRNSEASASTELISTECLRNFVRWNCRMLWASLGSLRGTVLSPADVSSFDKLIRGTSCFLLSASDPICWKTCRVPHAPKLSTRISRTSCMNLAGMYIRADAHTISA